MIALLVAAQSKMVHTDTSQLPCAQRYPQPGMFAILTNFGVLDGVGGRSHGTAGAALVAVVVSSAGSIKSEALIASSGDAAADKMLVARARNTLARTGACKPREGPYVFRSR